MKDSSTDPNDAPAPREWDHLTAAKQCLQAFFSDPNSGVFVLKGDYGSGKSYFLRETILTDKEVLNEFRFVSYTSVFGVNDHRELASAAIGSVQFGGAGLKGGIVETGLKIFQKALEPFIGGVNLELSASSIIWAMAHDSGLLLIIDDIDRRGEGLSIKTIVGFANSLAEHTKGKVRTILVINEDKLEGSDRSEWESLREKAIDAEFTFEPSPAELADHFIKTPELKTIIGEIHTAFESSNIRTMLKIERQTNAACRLIEEAGIRITDEELRRFAKFIFLFFRAGSEYSTDELLGSSLDYLEMFGKTSKREESPLEAKREAFRESAARIDFIRNNAWDSLLMQFMSTGQMPATDLNDLRDHLLSVESRNEFDSADRSLWSLIHRSGFKDTTATFLAQAPEHVTKFIDHFDIDNFARLAVTFDSLGGNSAPLWRVWLSRYRNHVDFDTAEKLKIWMPEEVHSLLPEPESKGLSQIDPAPYFKSIAEHHSIPTDKATLELLAAWNEEAWETWIRASECDDLLPALERIFTISWDDPYYNQIKTRLGRVVARIAKESPLNELRAKRYLTGVERFLNIPRNGC